MTRMPQQQNKMYYVTKHTTHNVTSTSLEQVGTEAVQVTEYDNYDGPGASGEWKKNDSVTDVVMWLRRRNSPLLHIKHVTRRWIWFSRAVWERG